MTDVKPLNVLFLCTHNSARSILAEALLNHVGHGKFKAYSAGSSPRDNQKPNPMAIATLQKAGISTEGLTSKSWDVFAVPDAPQMDLVITVCDNAAGEVCPYWPGQPATAHWGYADPSEAAGGDAAARRPAAALGADRGRGGAGDRAADGGGCDSRVPPVPAERRDLNRERRRDDGTHRDDRGRQSRQALPCR